MNKIIKLTLALCFLSLWTYGQDCINDDNSTPCCNGIIRTDPRPQHTSNTEISSFENSFDWRTYGDFNVYHPDGGYDFGQGVPYQVGNPFFKNLSYLKHINNFPAVPRSQSGDDVLDFHPEDGWELEQIQDTSINKNRVFFEFTGSNIIFGTTPENNPLRFEGSVKYSRDFQFLHIKSVQISPLVGYEYFNYTFNNAQYKSQINSLLYGLNIALTLGKKKQFELGIQSILFNEAVKTLSNNSTLSYKQNGYEFNVYFGPNLNIKSLGVCPFALLGYTERTEYTYNTDRKSLNLKIGLQIKL